MEDPPPFPRGPIRIPENADSPTYYLCGDGRRCTQVPAHSVDPDSPEAKVACECYAASLARIERAAGLLLERRLLGLAGVDISPPEGEEGP